MEKKHISLWIDDEILKSSDEIIKTGASKNRSEYFEEALKFYNSYLTGHNYEDYISKTLLKVFQGTMDSFEKRMVRQLFKQSVEISKIFWLIIKELDIDPEDANTLHADCVVEVKKINGAIQFPHKQKND